MSQVQDLITRVRNELLDTKTTKRYLDAELIDYVNDAQLAVLNAKPNSLTEKRAIALVEGAEQAVPPDALQVLGFIRNTAGPGLREGDRDEFDSEDPTWYSRAATTVASYVMYSPDDLRRFFVYPPNDATGSLDTVITPTPVKLTAITDELALSDAYLEALTHAVLSRCYLKDSDFEGNQAMAQLHHARMLEVLGMKTQAEMVGTLDG